MLYEINKTTETVVHNANGNTESIQITEVVRQGSIFGPKTYRATLPVVNDVGKKVDYKYVEMEIRTSIYMDDISVAGESEEVKKWNKEMCKNGSGKENAIQFKQKEVYDSKDRQRKGGRSIRTSDSEEHTKNHQIQILRRNGN